MLSQSATTQKKVPTLQDNIAETLFIPLYMRAKLTQSHSPIIKDTSAVNLVEQIEYDFSKFNRATLSLIGCGVRADYFDKKCLAAILQTLSQNKNIVIVNVGCGLDDRYQRVFEQAKIVPEQWQQQVHFFEMDLPEVMALRQQLLPPHRNQTYIAGSLLDKDWFNALLPVQTDTTDYLILIEGVLMYFNESQVKDFFLTLAEFFTPYLSPSTDNINDTKIPQVTLIFDAVTGWIVKNSHHHDSVSKTKANFKWAMEDNAILAQWNRRYQLQEEKNIMDIDIQANNWGLLAKLIRLIPKVRQGSKIITYQLK